ncbi:MAG: sigma-54 interaction domain-containing protein [Bacteriovoracia bacterium]
MWNLSILDPSGETRTVKLPTEGETEVSGVRPNGERPAGHVELRDPTARAVLNLRMEENAVFFRVDPTFPPVRVGGLEVFHGRWPEEITLQLGETKLVLQRPRADHTLPKQPSHLVPWLTDGEAGRQVLWTLKKTAPTSLSIYFEGETGTGKEILAQLAHAWSERATGPFVPLNCGALSVSLAESELFGHVKGAFTGADRQRPGALMQAHGGTLFLDEVGDLSPEIQVKLLRFLENGEIRPVGSDSSHRADVRVVCATHKPLESLVAEGKFRRDLYFRLASITIAIPALRDRPEDVELLARRFADSLQRGIATAAISRLQAHAWPGNVRELRHAVERACGMAGPFQSILQDADFQFLLTPRNVAARPEVELGAAVLTLKEMERVMLLKALRISRGNRAKAARTLGIARSTLFEMLKRHRIMGPKYEELQAAGMRGVA